MADLSMPVCADNTVPPATLDTAIHVAQQMLAAYGEVGVRDIDTLNRAHGALTESLRLLLRALDAEPDKDQAPAPRCPAAHPDDPTPCNGPVVVTILDCANAGADGCEHHATRLLATLGGGRPVAKPDAPARIALQIFRNAHHTQPYPWRGERP